ncbi:hypothetical protein N7454_001211 [Penicillium verhagenii]|nr:hypothetical protein N7454_001211 [Penicillium verhagenii]
MDTRASLAILPEAMQTLSMVASTYNTEALAEAYSTACLLILLHQQRRKDDINVLGEALNVHHQATPIESPQQFNPNEEEYSWLSALVADLPGLQRVDLEQFLNADMLDASLFMGGAI